jgi:hypothetical protein
VWVKRKKSTRLPVWDGNTKMPLDANRKGTQDTPRNDTILVSLAELAVREFTEVPDEVNGAAFTTDSTRLAIVGDGQAWLFSVADRKLLWRTALPAAARQELDGSSLFDADRRVAVSGEVLIVQYGDNEVAALSLSTGELRWISADIGLPRANG